MSYEDLYGREATITTRTVSAGRECRPIWLTRNLPTRRRRPLFLPDGHRWPIQNLINIADFQEHVAAPELDEDYQTELANSHSTWIGEGINADDIRNRFGVDIMSHYCPAGNGQPAPGAVDGSKLCAADGFKQRGLLAFSAEYLYWQYYSNLKGKIMEQALTGIFALSRISTTASRRFNCPSPSLRHHEP
jgi:hypothetical protein